MRRPELLLVLALFACGGPQKDTAPAPPPDAAAPAFDEAAAAQLAAELLGVLQEMAEIVEARADDCPAMATDLGALFDRAEPVFARARATEAHSEHARMLTAAMNDLAPQAQPLGDRISPRLEACGNEPALVEVMARMPVL
jgi:hypothetical protein